MEIIRLNSPIARSVIDLSTIAIHIALKSQQTLVVQESSGITTHVDLIAYIEAGL